MQNLLSQKSYFGEYIYQTPLTIKLIKTLGD